MTPTVAITVIGSRRSVQLDAILDTGFTGALCLPMDVASWVGVEIAGWGRLVIADGNEVKVLRGICQLELLGETHDVTAFVTDVAEPLIGTELLDQCELHVDFQSGQVHLTRKQP